MHHLEAAGPASDVAPGLAGAALGAQRSAHRMSRVGAWHIGIERARPGACRAVRAAPPERHLLAPDGRPVETHVASLVSPRSGRNSALFDYARPQLEFHGLLQARRYRQALRGLSPGAHAAPPAGLQAAACLLGERLKTRPTAATALNLLQHAV
ncbi:YscX family type III secretion protein [Pseudomonas aeruginosa]